MALAWGTVFGACCTPRVMSGCTPPKRPDCVFSRLWFFVAGENIPQRILTLFLRWGQTPSRREIIAFLV